MTKLSPHHRNDSIDGLSPELQEYLDKAYFQKLPNLTHKSPRVLVVFSAGNAMGKSTLAQKIGRELNGLVLENDGVKRALLAKLPNISKDDLNICTWRYTMNLYKRLGALTPNGLIVRDGVIDWYFEQILPIFERQGYKLFIVGYDITAPKRISLIQARGDTPTTKATRLISLLQDHDTHIARFREHYEPAITLTDETIFDHDAVTAKLRAFIASQ